MKLYVYLCPNCRGEQVPAGCYRTRCGSCGTYYSIDDERPEEKDRRGWWWERNQRRYPTPAIRRRVIFATPDTEATARATSYAEVERLYLADETVARTYLQHLVEHHGVDGGCLLDAVARWIDETPETADERAAA